MAWLQSLDVALFRFVNHDLSNPVFDHVMPVFAGHPLFFPAMAVIAGWLCWKGGTRGRVFVVLLGLVLALGDNFVINTLKEAIARPRPFEVVAGTHLLVGLGRSESMPSSHAATWAAAAMIAFLYYRRSWRFMAPLALTQAFSRLYLGVHYPSDVMAGMILGAGYASAGVLGLNALWQYLGRTLFPDWWRRLPSLVQISETPVSPGPKTAPAVSAHNPNWLRLGYLVIAGLLLFRFGYLAAAKIELSEDEAYQWLWSKHLALSYYSKPPMIAWLQWLGTSLWGDRELGVRFCSPVISAVLCALVLRFLAREISPAAGFWTVVLFTFAPMLAVGSTLMTVDPPLVLFWTLAMLLGWRALQPDGATRHWLGVGLCLGLGFLSKYSAAFQIASFALFMAWWPPARGHWRRPGPWLALLIFALCTLPVVVWNAQHGWITVHHVGENAKLDKPWEPTLRYFFEFIGAEAGILNPVFFVGLLCAMAAAWKGRAARPLWLYFLCMGAPVFLGYCAYTLHSRVLPNWIAPAVVPLFCLLVAWGHEHWLAGRRAVKLWLIAGTVLGAVTVTLLHDTNLLSKAIARRLPPKVDPHRRVHGWKETAVLVGEARQKFAQEEDRETFIIGGHYGITSQISFYLPEARASVKTIPLVYYRATERPRNQFFFWPGYRAQRPGQNAIYVQEAPLRQLKRGWLWPWLGGSRDLYEVTEPPGKTVPPELAAQFESVTDLGVHYVVHRGQVLRRVQLFACRRLR